MTNDDDLDLVTDDPAPALEAAAWGAVGLAGAAATATVVVLTGWLARAGWHAARDFDALRWLPFPRLP